MAGIGCDYCAFCFDEALSYREQLAVAKAAEQAEFEAQQRHRHEEAVAHG